jgi:hypothetical protein
MSDGTTGAVRSYLLAFERFWPNRPPGAAIAVEFAALD